jgi:hypothetical protein
MPNLYHFDEAETLTELREAVERVDPLNVEIRGLPTLLEELAAALTRLDESS